MNLNKKIILFGAGQFGKKALRYFGRERVYCFADNNQALAGGEVESVPVISFQKLCKIHEDYQIVLSVDVGTSFVLATQLEDAGIHDYIMFLELLKKATAEGLLERNASSVIHPENRDWKGKRVLMIAYQFPPLSGSGVFRSLKFAKYLSEFGWKPTVIAADHSRPGWNYSDESLVEEIPDDVDVIRIPDRINSFLEKSLLDCEDTLLPFLREFFQGHKKACSLVSQFENTRTGRAELMTFPCDCLAWAYDIVKYIEENIDISKFQTIYTTSGPYSAHLVGAFFKRKYGFPWVADYRDPWTENAYLYEDKSDNRFKLLRELESILLQAADKNIWVEENTAQLHKQHFDLPQNKVSSITNGYDEADFADLEVSEAQPEKFTIVYCGVAMVSAAITGIQAFFSALRPLLEEGKLDPSKVSCWFIGDARQSIQELAESCGVGDVVRESGYHPHKEALRANLDANLLLHVIGDGERQKYAHASKIFEYLRCGRPILSLAPTDGVVAQTLRETGHGKAYLNTDIPRIQSMILQEYQKWQRGEKRELLHSPLIEQFERKHLTGKLAAIFDEVSC